MHSADKGGAMDKIIERGLLFDFYGELLTSHQQKIYSEAVFNDLSLQELSDEEGISRQGIHDLIKRCDKQLMQYEEKLGLVSKFQSIRKEVDGIEKIILKHSSIDDKTKDEICFKLKNIIEEL